jgi:hypothetical protein
MFEKHYGSLGIEVNVRTFEEQTSILGHPK